MQIPWTIFLITFGFIILDIITGVLRSIKQKVICSTMMREGLFHKSTYILIIALATLIEYATQYLNLGFEVPIIIPACIYICLTEVTSIIENLGGINEHLMNSKLLGLFKSTKEVDDDEVSTD